MPHLDRVLEVDQTPIGNKNYREASPVTICTQVAMEFPRCQRRVVEASFEAGAITSDGGALLLRQADRYLGLSAAVARALLDPRRQASCTHDGASLLHQRLFALALGYEDLNATISSCARMWGSRRRWIGIRRWPAARPCAGGRTGRTGRGLGAPWGDGGSVHFLVQAGAEEAGSRF